MKILIVEARFYEHIADGLLKSAMEAAHNAGFVFEVVTVPGALEIPGVIARLAPQFDCVVALGCVIRGETFHFEVVSTESARALMDLSLRFPLGNGIITVENEAQALARLNKGAEAANAALTVLKVTTGGN